MPGHSPEIGIDYDPVQGKQLLDKEQLNTIRLATFPGFGETPTFLTKSWIKHLSLNVEIVENLSAESILLALRDGDIQLILFSWNATFPDPDDVLRSLFHSESPINYFGWYNPKFDELVDSTLQFKDEFERMANYHQADKLLVNTDVAVLPLYYLQGYSLLRSRFSLASQGKIIRRGIKFKNILVHQ
jgi:oligopeptide transport system substrate-binding protein